MMTMSDSSSPYWRLVKRSWAKKKEKKTCPTLEDRVETINLQIHSFFSLLQSCMWAWKTLHPRKRPSNAKMTVETVETVVAAAPYAALIGHKLRPLLSDSQSALADCEEDVIQICHLLSRNGKLSLVRLTKSFPTIPNLRGIANANQNDERFKMWSVMLLCTISINLWKIFACHTGDWFDVRTASICTTDLWDALKSFILNSLKFKVAPYPIIVSLDTLNYPNNNWRKSVRTVIFNSWQEQ